MMASETARQGKSKYQLLLKQTLTANPILDEMCSTLGQSNPWNVQAFSDLQPFP